MYHLRDRGKNVRANKLPTNIFVRRAALVALVWLFSLFNLQHAAAIELTDAVIGLWTDDEHVLVIDGDLGANTAFNFKRTLNENPQVRTILLNSGGGIVSIGLDIAQLISNRRLDTWVPKEALCASACSVIYFSGVNRLAEGELGVHQIAMNVESNTDVQSTASDMIEAFNRYGTHPNVFSAMLRTPPEKMYYFTGTEKILFNIQRGILTSPDRSPSGVLLEPLPELIPPDQLFGGDLPVLKGLKFPNAN
jgi:hypothetical protein